MALSQRNQGSIVIRTILQVPIGAGSDFEPGVIGEEQTILSPSKISSIRKWVSTLTTRLENAGFTGRLSIGVIVSNWNGVTFGTCKVSPGLSAVMWWLGFSFLMNFSFE